jgi:hypothetical protein
LIWGSENHHALAWAGFWGAAQIVAQHSDYQNRRFADGTAEEFDVLIAATGYAIDLDFIPEYVLRVKNNQLNLYMRMIPPDWPGLFFMGFMRRCS